MCLKPAPYFNTFTIGIQLFYSVQSSGTRIFCNGYAWYFLMFINFYYVLTVLNLSNILKCVLLFPSDCGYVRNEIISIINKIILQSRGRIIHCVVAKRPGGEKSWGELSRWQNVQGAKHPGSKTSWGWNVQVANWRRGKTSVTLWRANHCSNSNDHRRHWLFIVCFRRIVVIIGAVTVTQLDVRSRFGTSIHE